jgi:hypothetical protein
MNVRHHFRWPPPVVRRRLLLDALLLWLGVRLSIPLVAVLATGSPMADLLNRLVAMSVVLPSPRTSIVVVLIAVFLCFTQVRGFRETHLLRNLGVSLQGQLLFSAAAVGALEIAARTLVILLLPHAGSG